jgi:rod shape determining protein RodA
MPINSKTNRMAAWRRLDYVLLLMTILLIGVGWLFIFGTGRQIGGDFARFSSRQLMWVVLATVAFVATVSVDYRLLARYSWGVYAMGLGLLGLVLLFGREINGAKSWLPVGPLTLQPSELAKPATALFLAWFASRSWAEFSRLPMVVLFGIAAVPPVLFIALQPDWGTALVFIPMALAVAFAAGLAWRWILVGIVVVMISAPLGYSFALAPHQKDRIKTFLNPSADISDTGWNAHQSLLAVGSGGTFGKGLMKGTQHVLGYLPKTVAPTDFIFSVIGEESGFVGALVVVCGFGTLLICCLRAASRAPDATGAYLCTGIAAMIFTHVYVNIGMTVYMAPVIGIPLPFISYGGSFLIGMAICMGLVQNVYARRDTPGVE